MPRAVPVWRLRKRRSEQYGSSCGARVSELFWSRFELHLDHAQRSHAAVLECSIPVVYVVAQANIEDWNGLNSTLAVYSGAVSLASFTFWSQPGLVVSFFIVDDSMGRVTIVPAMDGFTSTPFPLAAPSPTPTPTPSPTPSPMPVAQGFVGSIAFYVVISAAVVVLLGAFALIGFLLRRRADYKQI